MIPLSLPCITEADMKAVRQVMESGWLTTGKRCAEFEGVLRDIFMRDCIAVSSATAGLHLALRAFGVGPGWQVAVPTWTFTATAEAVEMCGATPVFADVDPLTRNVTPKMLEAAFYPTEDGNAGYACIPVHMAGLPCNMVEIGNWARARRGGVTVIEDAAHAFGACYGDGTMVGAGPLFASQATVFSFYATKGLTTLGEGGLITTPGRPVAKKIRAMRFHGVDQEAWDRNVTGSIGFDVVSEGYKYNMSDAQAAMGLSQLDHVGDWLKMRQGLAARYHAGLEGDFTKPALVVGHSWHLYQITLWEDCAEEFVGFMQKRGIACGIHYRPLHHNTYWRNKYHLRTEDFPGAQAVVARVVSLPMWAGLTLQQQDKVIEAVRGFFK